MNLKDYRDKITNFNNSQIKFLNLEKKPNKMFSVN